MRPIHHTFAPLADGPHVRLALRRLLTPWQWHGAASREDLRRALEEKFAGNAFLFASGREALLALFRDREVFPEGSEIIVQAYTCVVVPNAITAAGLVPLYADIEKDTLSMDPSLVEKLITPQTKAILCQHTFGIPAPVEALRGICDRHSLLLVEDCAHILPDKTGPEEIGKYGDALLLSFGRDKAISGVTGGAIVIRKRTAQRNSGIVEYWNSGVTSMLQESETQAVELPRWTVCRLLLYPIIYALARPVYAIGLGKVILKTAQLLKLLVPIVTFQEKEGHQSQQLHRMPEPCAALALDQLKKLQSINDHRRMLVHTYLKACAERGWGVLHGIRSDLPLQKFPLFVQDAEKIRRELKKRNIHLYDGWTGCVVCPADVNPEQAGYRSGTDPKAEEACEEILTLPTHPLTHQKDALQLIATLQDILTAHRS